MSDDKPSQISGYVNIIHKLGQERIEGAFRRVDPPTLRQTFVGIDVGLDGGISAIIEGAPMPFIFEMPTDTITTGTKKKHTKKRILREARLRQIFVEIQRESDGIFVLIERPQLRPAVRPTGHSCPLCHKPHLEVNQGIVSQAGFMEQYGLIRGILVGLGIPHEDIHPATWKSEMFHGASDKTDARELASRLFPAAAGRFALKKNDGLAEATLLAAYAVRRHSAPF